ncbi:polysaccharide pyruvyl transferase family protein [Escherichia albertii]|uniref:Predicted pyruvyl transferase n=1 Tax=Escherichia albertii TaxID=208962 RepID=A0A5A4U9U4_ESCAL|nr:polysaccharide pyruvyl transferase family protein [Escherichia albertii]MCZ8652357.1 polysaccharide pyruvyl transferase family protein [Escherichia albertii]WDB32652.1 polysaccharide pyruvyl transferase family protein [Escherichia albertii]WDB77284.1 polysaccharide pyruvyl transferase family protein [Escherichia albertii]BBM62803.1 predicted pyruvyl transferase [Escherichia albertii]
MKKIGVLNFQYSDHNYGAVLQAVALENVLKQLGKNAEHINFIPRKKSNKNIKQLVIEFLASIGLKSLIYRVFNKKVIIKNKVEGSEIFEDFRNKYLNRTKAFHSLNELMEVEDSYNSVIVGSDQVWRPKMYSNLTEIEIYFLSFISQKTKKISYAASFGVDRWEYDKNDNVTHKAQKYLNKFNSISVREKSGVEICGNVFDIRAEHVLDPTLLIGRDFFDNLIKDKQPLVKKTISYYKLDLCESFLAGIEHLANLTGYEPNNIYYKQLDNGSYEYYPVLDWLSMINSSSIIITDSFHCVCFSILFNKNFYCCLNKERGASRLESLLNELGLEDRLISEEELSRIYTIDEINYSPVEDMLNRRRKQSMEFLVSAIDG